MVIPRDIVAMLKNPVDSKDMLDTFCEFIEDIFACTKYEITELCEEFEFSELSELRKRLFNQLTEVMPTIQEHELCHRKKSKIMAEDVYIIGNSLVNGREDRRLKKILKPLKEKTNEISEHNGSLDASCLEDKDSSMSNSSLLQMCVDLKLSVKVLVGKVESLQAQVEKLESEATAMKLSIKLLSDNKKIQKGTLGPNDLIVEAEIHADVNGETHVPETLESLKDNTPFHHTSAERRNILRGVKRNHGTAENSKITVSNRFDVLGNSTKQSGIQAAPLLRSNQLPAETSHLIYVGRLAQRTSARDLRCHLLQSGVTNEDIADVIKLKCRNEWESSFCISVNTNEAKERVFQENNWPVGVKVRKYNTTSNPKHRHRHFRNQPRFFAPRFSRNDRNGSRRQPSRSQHKQVHSRRHTLADYILPRTEEVYTDNYYAPDSCEYYHDYNSCNEDYYRNY